MYNEATAKTMAGTMHCTVEHSCENFINLVSLDGGSRIAFLSLWAGIML